MIRKHGMVVAVDGPAASGKGTIARAIAVHYGLPYLDTGLLYRAAAVQFLGNGGDNSERIIADDDLRRACDFPDSLLDDSALRGEAVADIASRLSESPLVREALRARQAAFAQQASGAVLDGRDIGTVIVPTADVKLYVTANPLVRARRRFDEMRKNDKTIDLASIEADIRRRDERDSNRADAPLQKAHDAHLLDTSDLPIEQAIDSAIAIVDKKIRLA